MRRPVKGTAADLRREMERRRDIFRDGARNFSVEGELARMYFEGIARGFEISEDLVWRILGDGR